MRIKNLVIPSMIGCAALALGLKGMVGASAHAKSASRRTSDREPFAALDAYIQAQMKRLAIPGAELGVIEGNQIVHLRGFGHSRPGGDVPTPQTPFLIGSLTKSITALGVMQLVEAGKVDLDTPVQCYLPWFCLADPWKTKFPRETKFPTASARITVRHLLNQTSGLSMSAGMITPPIYDNLPDAVERYVRSALPTLKLAHPVGEVCEYCNLNYDLLGLVIEAASGERYADYVQKHIFDPLGMRHTYTSQAEAQQNGLAVGYRYWFGVPVPAPHLPVQTGSLPSGQIFSCVEDMARYLMAHLNGGRCGESQVLSEKGMHLLHQGAADYIMFGVKSGQYAMGWFDMEKGGTRLVTHGGNNPDFSAYAGFLPERKKGLVLLINADHFGLPPILGEVGFGATALLDHLQPEPIKLWFVPWIMRLLALVPLLQVLDADSTLRQARRWRDNPALRPSQARMEWQHLLLPVLTNLSLAAVPLFLRSRSMLGYLRLFMPDVYWTALLSGGFAGFWAILRAALVLQTTRKP